MNRKFTCMMIGVLLLAANAVFSQTVKVPPKTDETTPGFTLAPSPGEVLNALSKIGRVEWSGLVNYNKFYNYKGRNKQALNLGIRVADAFVALHDRDKTNFGNMNDVIFSLAKELNISNLIEDQKNKLKELSQKDDWVLLIIELNTMNAQMQEELIELKEDDIVLLSGIGAFFEGVHIVSSHFKKNYDPEKVSLLRQSALIHHYMADIDKNPKLREDETIKTVYDGLMQLKRQLESDPAISPAAVDRINAISGSVVNSMTK
jgi:hypothetical protein